MNFDPVVDGVVFVTASAVVLLMLRRLLVTDGATLADLFAHRVDPGWPRGVQEDEPVRYRIEFLPNRDRRVDPAASARVSTDRRHLAPPATSNRRSASPLVGVAPARQPAVTMSRR